MASNVNVMREIRQFVKNITFLLQRWKGMPPHQGMVCAPALALDGSPYAETSPAAGNRPSVLESIFDGIVYAAVPKFRKSYEKKFIRKFAEPRMVNAKPKKNIVACLECGNWHESHTICGHCYKKVREETAAMRDAMGVDSYKYNQPRSEVMYRYEDDPQPDDRPMYKGKYIVEMKKPRPQWFPKNLLTKGHVPES